MCMKKESSEIPVKRCGGSCATTRDSTFPTIDPERQHEQCHGHADTVTPQGSGSTKDE
jgi:hypothetical protein